MAIDDQRMRNEMHVLIEFVRTELDPGNFLEQVLQCILGEREGVCAARAYALEECILEYQSYYRDDFHINDPTEPSPPLTHGWDDYIEWLLNENMLKVARGLSSFARRAQLPWHVHLVSELPCTDPNFLDILVGRVSHSGDTVTQVQTTLNHKARRALPPTTENVVILITGGTSIRTCQVVRSPGSRLLPNEVLGLALPQQLLSAYCPWKDYVGLDPRFENASGLELFCSAAPFSGDYLHRSPHSLLEFDGMKPTFEDVLRLQERVDAYLRERLRERDDGVFSREARRSIAFDSLSSVTNSRRSRRMDACGPWLRRVFGEQHRSSLALSRLPNCGYTPVTHDIHDLLLHLLEAFALCDLVSHLELCEICEKPFLKKTAHRRDVCTPDYYGPDCDRERDRRRKSDARGHSPTAS